MFLVFSLARDVGDSGIHAGIYHRLIIGIAMAEEFITSNISLEDQQGLLERASSQGESLFLYNKRVLRNFRS
ncbi:unnamed protein product [Rhodiola kirilowii]